MWQESLTREDLMASSLSWAAALSEAASLPAAVSRSATASRVRWRSAGRTCA